MLQLLLNSKELNSKEVIYSSISMVLVLYLYHGKVFVTSFFLSFDKTWAKLNTMLEV